LAGLSVAVVALRKSQSLTVEFVKAHIQGIRADTNQNTTAMKALLRKVEALEKRAASGPDEEDPKAQQLRPSH